jgi:hypothetical protein
MRSPALLLAAIALVAGACGIEDDPALDPGAATLDGPSLRIVAPIDESTLPAGSLLVQVWVQEFEVVERLGEEASAGEGHVHFYLNVEVPTEPGEPATTAEGTYHASADTVHTWEDVEPGTHTVSAQLVNNDHTPLDPPVVASVSVTLE